MRRDRLAALALAAALFILPGCGVSQAPPIERHYLHGVVVRLDAQDHTASIKHGEIKGFMGAMTMEFPVRNADEFARLRVDETIDATVFVQDTDFWVGEIKETK